MNTQTLQPTSMDDKKKSLTELRAFMVNNNEKFENFENIEEFCIIACSGGGGGGSSNTYFNYPPAPDTYSSVSQTSNTNLTKVYNMAKTVNENVSESISMLNKKIDNSTIANSINNMVKSAVSNVMSKNESSLSVFVDANNLFKLSDVDADGDFILKNVDQTIIIEVNMDINAQQTLTTKIQTEFTSEISNQIDIAFQNIVGNKNSTNQEGDPNTVLALGRLAQSANLNATLAAAAAGKASQDAINNAAKLAQASTDAVAAAGKAAMDAAAELAKKTIGGSDTSKSKQTSLTVKSENYTSTDVTNIVDETSIKRAYSNIQEEINIDNSVKANSENNVETNIKNILSQENLKNTISRVAANNTIEMQRIRTKKNVNISDIKQTINIKSITKELINQIQNVDLGNKAADKISRVLSNKNTTMSETSSSDTKNLGSATAIGAGMAAIIAAGGDAADKALKQGNVTVELAGKTAAEIAKAAQDKLDAIARASMANSAEQARDAANARLKEEQVAAALKLGLKNIDVKAAGQMSGTTIAIMIIVIVLLIGGASFAYWYTSKDDNKNATDATNITDVTDAEGTDS